METNEQNNKTYKILIVDNDSDNARVISDYLETSEIASFEITYVKEAPRAADNIAGDEFDGILLSFNPDSDDDGIIFNIKHIYPAQPIILMVDTVNTDIEKKILYYIKASVWGYIAKDEINRSQFTRYILFTIERFNKAKSAYKKLEALESVEETLHGIMEENPEPILIVDANGTIRFVNQPAESLFGRDKDGLIGEIFNFSINPRRTTEIEVTRSDGRKVLLEMRSIAMVWQKEVAYLICLHNITSLVNIREEMRAMYLVDELTGIFNQRGMIILGEQQLKIANRTRKGMFFIYVNILGLSNINKNFGFSVGDEALTDTSSILKETLRKSDIIARLYDGNFLILAVDAKEEGGDAICFRIQNNIDSFNNSTKRKYKIAVDIKRVYYNPDNPSSINDIIAQFLK